MAEEKVALIPPPIILAPDKQGNQEVSVQNPQSPRSVSSRTGGETASKERWEKLQNLNDLYDQGFITLAEFHERKAQLIDELTGTRGTASGVKSPRKSNSVPQKIPYKVFTNNVVFAFYDFAHIVFCFRRIARNHQIGRKSEQRKQLNTLLMLNRELGLAVMWSLN